MAQNLAALDDEDATAGDSLGRGDTGNLPAFEMDTAGRYRTLVDGEDAGNRFQRGALAGPIGAEQDGAPALLDPQVDAFEGEDNLGVEHLEVVERQYFRAHGFLLRG